MEDKKGSIAIVCLPLVYKDLVEDKAQIGKRPAISEEKFVELVA